MTRNRFEEIYSVTTPLEPDQLNEIGYLRHNPDVAAAGIPALTHFLYHGRAEGRKQFSNSEKIAAVRRKKLQSVKFLAKATASQDADGRLSFLSEEVISEFDLPDNPPISANPYNPQIMDLIRNNPKARILDLGAGLREIYFSNVINTEIYPSASTDIICVGEDLPFAANQFDMVFCFAVLEHTLRPWIVAKEIIRVLKPGGTAHIDYPFLQPVHGYPHHYFNATMQGSTSLFVEDCDIVSCDVEPSQHPMFSMQWVLKEWAQGLLAPDLAQFRDLTIGDILDRPIDALRNEGHCRNLNPDAARKIAAGFTFVARKH